MPICLVCFSYYIFYKRLQLSTHVAAGGDDIAGGEQDKAAVFILGTENHALTLDTLELARGEVGNETDLFANERLRVGVVFGNAADDGSRSHSILNLELQQFVGLGDLLAFEDGTHTDVHLAKVVDGDRGFHFGRFPCVEFVLDLGGLQLVDLGLDGLVADLLEEELGFLDGVTFHEDVGTAGISPTQSLQVHHGMHLVGSEGQEGGTEDSEVGADLEREVHHRGGALGVGLDEFPGLGVGEVLVTQSGEVHHLGKSLTETVGFDATANAFGEGGYFLDNLLLGLSKRSAGGHLSAIELMRQHEGTIHEVAEDGNQLGVVLQLEILPGEVVILGLGGVGAEGVAQHVLLSGELAEVFVQPDGPVA